VKQEKAAWDRLRRAPDHPCKLIAAQNA
jgi:hypothetical protein